MHHGESKDDGTVDFYEGTTWWDFYEIAGATKIAAMDVSHDWVSILVEIAGDVDDVEIGATARLEAAKVAEEGV